jgi:dephospho-CoA kinase
VAALLDELGFARIDLDDLSREVLAPGSPLLADIAAAFGADVLGEGGVLDRALLAQRAFATPEATQRLEDLELPAIKELLVARLDELRSQGTHAACVVEVPLPDRMGPLLSLADELICVSCPLELRRERAVGRGMSAEDFDRRAARQMSEDDLYAIVDVVFNNAGDEALLKEQVEAWWALRSQADSFEFVPPLPGLTL